MTFNTLLSFLGCSPRIRDDKDRVAIQTVLKSVVMTDFINGVLQFGNELDHSEHSSLHVQVPGYVKTALC